MKKRRERPRRRSPAPWIIGAVLAGGGGLAWWFLAARESSGPGRTRGSTGRLQELPNVLFITVDTLRADHLSSYGSEVVMTPHIDQLAAEGLRFHRAISHVPLTLPSHASLFTGMDPLSHGVHNNGTFVLESRFTTLAEAMRDHGYRTAAFVGAIPLDSRFGIDQGYELYDDRYPTRGDTTLFLAERPADQVTRPAMEWLREQGDGRWFCWIHVFDPHAPYTPPAPFDEKYRSNPYAGEVAYVDEVLGDLFDFLRERGLYDTTWIVFTSDHGEGRGDHQERNHGSFTYHSTLWVPLIFRYPGWFPAGAVIEERVRLTDIMPTVLDYLGLPIPEGIQGESLRPLITGSSEWEAKPFYFESMALALNFNWAPPRGLYLGKYKYIDLPLPELYDVEADFNETQNLVQSEPQVVETLRRRLTEIVEDRSVDGSVAAGRRVVDPETLERLRALGYASGGYADSAAPSATFGEDDDPKRLIGLLNLVDDARNAYQEGRRENAVKLYLDLIRLRPDFALAHASLAYIYKEMGRLREAIEILEAAYRRGVRSEMVAVRLGSYLREAGRLARAAEVLGAARESYPESVEVQDALAMTLWDQGRNGDAISIFEDILRQNPSLASAHNNLGSLYLDERRYDLALAHFQRALEIDPQQAEALNGLGVVYASTGRSEEAVSAWKEAVGLDPHRCDTLLNLGMMLLRGNRSPEAIQYLERFLNAATDPKYRKDVAQVRELLAKLRSAR